jgi:SAM-dependent methyltransferase
VVNFDRVARVYRWLEYVVFGHALQRARIRWLDDLGRPTRSLVIGEGDGRFIYHLAQKWPGLAIDCVEASAGMIERAQRRLQTLGTDAPIVRFIQEDIRDWTPKGSYDLVVTHFLLDCFDENELGKIVPLIAAVLSAGGVWLLADFTIPERGIGKVCAQVLIPPMYRFFRIFAGLQTKRLIDPTARLTASGLKCEQHALSLCGIVKSERWQKEPEGN